MGNFKSLRGFLPVAISNKTGEITLLGKNPNLQLPQDYSKVIVHE